MGFSTSGATVVIFLGLLVSIGIIYPPVEHAFEDVSAALDDRDDRALEKRNTRVDIVNATYNTSNGTLVLRVDNVGSVTEGVEETDVLVDGVISTNYTTSVEGTAGRSIWAPGERLAFRVSTNATPDRVAVVTELGVTDVTSDVTEVS